MDWSRLVLAGAEIGSCGFGPAGESANRWVSGVRSPRRRAVGVGVGALSWRYASVWAWPTPERSAGVGAESCRAAGPTAGLESRAPLARPRPLRSLGPSLASRRP